MTLYLDTSLVVSALTAEPVSPQVQVWLEAQPLGSLLISDWTVTEFGSALGIKVRSNQISVRSRANALARFHQLAMESFAVLGVSSPHFRIAAGYVDRFELGLRASDALHLALASDAGAEMCTLDRRMAAAAPQLGVPAQLVA